MALPGFPRLTSKQWEDYLASTSDFVLPPDPTELAKQVNYTPPPLPVILTRAGVAPPGGVQRGTTVQSWGSPVSQQSIPPPASIPAKPKSPSPTPKSSTAKKESKYPGPKPPKVKPLSTKRAQLQPFQPSAFPLPADWDLPQIPPFRPSSAPPPSVPPPSRSLDRWQPTSRLGQFFDNLRLTSGEAAARLSQNPLDDRSMRVFSRKLERLNKRSPVAGNMYAEEFANQLPADSMAKQNLMNALAAIQSKLAQEAATTKDIEATTEGRREVINTSIQNRDIIRKKFAHEMEQWPIQDQAFTEAAETPGINPLTLLALRVRDLPTATTTWPGMPEGERIARLQAQTSSNNLAAQLANTKEIAQLQSYVPFGQEGVPKYAWDANVEGTIRPGTWQYYMNEAKKARLAEIAAQYGYRADASNFHSAGDNYRNAYDNYVRLLTQKDKVDPALIEQARDEYIQWRNLVAKQGGTLLPEPPTK